MKRVAVLLLTMVMCISLWSCDKSNNMKETEAPVTEAPTAEPTPDINSFDYSEKTFDVDALFENSKLQGRTTVQEYKISTSAGKGRGIALDYTASSVEFNAYCEGTVTLSIFTQPTTIGGSKCYINVYVDGVKQGEKRTDFMFSGKKLRDVVIAENLPRGYHSFLIEKQTEAERAFIYVNSVTMSGVFAEKPQNKELFIEFIGDSITTGYGNLWPDQSGEKKTEQAYNEYVDGTKTYAVLTAKALNADYSVVAQQGIGCVIGYYSHTMLKTYTQTCYQCNRKDEWGFERKADVVVIALGTNDNTFFSNGSCKIDKLETGFREFLALVREKNPESKILWIYGMMGVGSETARVIQDALNEAGGEAAGYYYQEMKANHSGGNGHPNLAGHEENAEILTNRIKEILKIKG